MLLNIKKLFNFYLILLEIIKKFIFYLDKIIHFFFKKKIKNYLNNSNAILSYTDYE